MKASKVAIFIVALAVMYMLYDRPDQSGHETDISVADIYVSQSGEIIAVYNLPNESLEMHFMQHDGVYLKAFVAHRAPSASGETYVSEDGRFTFWSKGMGAFILGADGEKIFTGTQRTSGRETIYFDPAQREGSERFTQAIQ